MSALLAVWVLGIAGGVVGATEESEIKAFVGQSVALPCRLDTSVCGNLHSVKFYRETSRIYVYSQVGGVARAEGDATQRMTVEYKQDRMEALLEINPVEVEDEATYKCEITYLEVLENCAVVQLIKLKTLVRPSKIRLLQQDGQELVGPVLGPYNEGTPISVTCEAISGRPTPDVKWYNGSREIKSKYTAVDNRDGTGTGVAKLELLLSRGDLQATFECKVESDALDKPYTTSFTADVNVRPTGIRLYGVNASVVQGSKVRLRCDVSGAKPAAEVRWFNKSVPITNEQLISTDPQVMSDGTYTTRSALSFHATRWENGNSFHCYADNAVIRDQKESDLQSVLIIDVEYPPVVDVHPINITVNESDRTILYCTYMSNPMALLGIVWKKDGQNLTITEDRYEGGSLDDLALVIKNVSRDDMGEYKCMCRNKVAMSESEATIYLNVQYTPTVEVKLDPSTPVRAEDRGNVTLFCEVTAGNPNTLSKVKWFMNSELILELPECNYTSYDEDGNGEGYGGPYCGIDSSVLLLLNVTETFAGNYSCQGKNVVGWGPKSSDQELIVYYPPKGTKLRSVPTKIIKKSSVTLNCTVERLGIPEDVTYEWYRGTHLVPDINTANWTISPVTLETKSNFTCIAKNAGGSSSPASLSLQVLAPPAFIQNLYPYQGIPVSSKNISLTCRVECYPLCEIFWLKDHVRIARDNDRYTIKQMFYKPDTNKNDFESVESTLIFKLENWPGNQLDKSAPNSNYTCVSTPNEVGPSVNTTAEIAVDFPPEDLTAIPRLVKVKEHQRPDEILCSGKGHPQLTYSWRADGSDKNISNTHKLSLKTVTRNDSGKYICMASNRHGDNTTYAYIDVQYIPDCTLETEIQDGQPTLVCTARANPREVEFLFRIKSDNETIGSDEVKGLKGYLRLDSGVDTFRTYQCLVTNSIGTSAPCERDVAGTVSWWKQFASEKLIILIAIAVGIIVCLIIICIIVILVCRRKNANNKFTFRKFNPPTGGATNPPTLPSNPPPSRKRKKPGSMPNQSSMGDKGGLGGTPQAGGIGDPLNDQDKLFYENLPFHGMQNPPNKPISIITPTVHTKTISRLPKSPCFASDQNAVNLKLQNNPIGVTRNQSFPGFKSTPPVVTNLNTIKFSSPLGTIRTNSNIGRVSGRNEYKLDIRRTASGINIYPKEEQPSITESVKETKPKHHKFGSLELKKHKCYSPTFYSMRCKKHGKRRPVIYALVKRPKCGSKSCITNSKSTKDESGGYQNLSESIQILEKNKDTPRPAPRCKKHAKTEIIYQNVYKEDSSGVTNVDSSNNSSVQEAEVSITKAEIHEKPNTEPNDSKPEAVTCKITENQTLQTVQIQNLKVTPTLKVSPNFVKPKTESPKGALYLQLQAKLKNSPNQQRTPPKRIAINEAATSLGKEMEKQKESHLENNSLKKCGLNQADSNKICKAKTSSLHNAPNSMPVPKMPLLDTDLLSMRANNLSSNIANLQNAFYTLTTPHYKHSSSGKQQTPPQYSTIPNHQKHHTKLLPRSLFNDHHQQISKSKSFSSKTKPKKHFQIPLQKCHSFRFQTAESYFQPIKNIHEENLMRNGYAADLNAAGYRTEGRTRNKTKDKCKGPLVVRRPNEYQENVQFQENMHNSVQLQYPQPVLGRVAANGVVYADLDMPKTNKYPEGSTASSGTHHKPKKTEYATLKFNDIGQEIDV